MTKKTAPAKAASQDVSAEKKKAPITGGRIIRIPRGDVSYPAVVFQGDLPKKGEKLTFKMTNRTLYSGTVHDAAEVDGEIICEFRTGLVPVRAK